MRLRAHMIGGGAVGAAILAMAMTTTNADERAAGKRKTLGRIERLDPRLDAIIAPGRLRFPIDGASAADSAQPVGVLFIRAG